MHSQCSYINRVTYVISVIVFLLHSDHSVYVNQVTLMVTDWAILTHCVTYVGGNCVTYVGSISQRQAVSMLVVLASGRLLVCW